MNFFDEHNVNFVPSEKNSQNSPRAPPFETIWQILKEKAFAGGLEAKTIDQLKRRI